MDESTSDFEIKLDALRRNYVERCRRRVSLVIGSLDVEVLDLDVVHQLHSMAHELAGSGATYGFPEITRAAETIEHFLDPVVRRQTGQIDQDCTGELCEMLEHLENAIPGDFDAT